MANGLENVEWPRITFVAEVLVRSVLLVVYADTCTMLPYRTSLAENGETVVFIDAADT